jgi:hypothetical protein
MESHPSPKVTPKQRSSTQCNAHCKPKQMTREGEIGVGVPDFRALPVKPQTIAAA